MMKFYALLLCLLVTASSYGQELKPIAKKINDRRAQRVVLTPAQLFSVSPPGDQTTINTSGDVTGATILDFQPAMASNIVNTRPDNLSMSIPLESGGTLDLDLFSAPIFAPDFSVVTATSKDQPVPYSGGVHYWGIIRGDNSSLVAISIFNDEVMGMISSPTEGNLVLGKLKNNQQGRHILYNEHNLNAPPLTQCYTPDDHGVYQSKDLQTPTISAVNCIRLYWEVNYDIFQGKGSVTAATNYVTGIFNQSAIIYTNDNIPVSLSQVFVWDTVSPYTATSTSSLLTQFKNYRNSFNGDLGHLLGYAGGGGIAAGFNGLCNTNTDNQQCYSGINPGYNAFPTYSWSVMVVTHEQGHLMGSRHTHACVWNGNSTAIDGCGPAAGYAYEGSCTGAPVPSGGGTIMSYCHLLSVGINLSLGFGPQPKAAILSKYNAATCLTACSGGSTCNLPTTMNTSSITTSSAIFSWSAATGAVSYNVQYRTIGAPAWTSANTTQLNYTATGLASWTSFEWQVQTVCTSGSSAFSSSVLFTTAAVSCGIPSGLTSNTITTTDATLTWSPVAGAVSYNIQWKATSASLWNTLSAWPNTSRTLSGLTSCTGYQFQVQTICSGTISAYSNTSSFTTSGCAPVTYCVSRGNNTSYRYINKVVLGSINNTSGNNNGYGDYTNMNTSLTGGILYTISLTPGPKGHSYPQYWNVYIDYNHNGSFDDAGEKVALGNSNGSVNLTFTVPASAFNGVTRMRVQMQNNSYPSGSCAVYTYGEVEDYSVNINGNAQLQQPATTGAIAGGNNIHGILLYPNPAHDQLTVECYSSSDELVNINFFNLIGQVTFTKEIAIQNGRNVVNLNTSFLNKGIYILEIQSGTSTERRRFIIE